MTIVPWEIVENVSMTKYLRKDTMIITKQNTINNQAVLIQLQEGIKNLFRISKLLIQVEKFSQVALKLDQHLQDPLKKGHLGISPTQVCWNV